MCLAKVNKSKIASASPYWQSECGFKGRGSLSPRVNKNIIWRWNLIKLREEKRRRFRSLSLQIKAAQRPTQENKKKKKELKKCIKRKKIEKLERKATHTPLIEFSVCETGRKAYLAAVKLLFYHSIKTRRETSKSKN